MEETPLVSVICLSYNHEKYIQKALTSIIKQSYSNFEIIYLDNSSADQTFEIGNKILKNSGIKYISKQFESNVGIPKAFNYAIRNLIKGEYICIMSLDDWLELENIQEKINYFQQHPNCGVVYSYGNFYYEDTDELQPVPHTYFKEGMIFDDLLKRNFVYTMGSVIKKEVYENIGLYNENNTIEDWEFSLRVSQKYEYGLVKKPLFNYRRHNSNYSNGSKNYYLDCFKILTPYKKHDNYKIGFNWINNMYLKFIMSSKPSLSSFFYLIKYFKFNSAYSKQVFIYFYKLCFRIFN